VLIDILWDRSRRKGRPPVDGMLQEIEIYRESRSYPDFQRAADADFLG